MEPNFQSQVDLSGLKPLIPVGLELGGHMDSKRPNGFGVAAANYYQYHKKDLELVNGAEPAGLCVILV